MVVYRHADIEVVDPEAMKCGVDHTHDVTALRFSSLMESGMDFDELNKRADSGCPTDIKVLYMVSPPPFFSSPFFLVPLSFPGT